MAAGIPTCPLVPISFGGHQEGLMPSSTGVAQDPRLVRADDDWLRLPNPWNIPVDICAGPDVPIEPSAVDEILTVLETAGTLERLAAVTGHEAAIDRVVLTPDLHKGSGIPIGTVLRTSGALLPQ